LLGFQSVFPFFQHSDVFDGVTKDVGFAALACDLDTVHKPSLVNVIDDCAILAVRDTDPRTLDDSMEGGWIESLGGGEDNMGGIDGGEVDAADEEEEELEVLVEGRRWRRGMGSFWEGTVAVRN
jgi:hypothetical protein